MAFAASGFHRVITSVPSMYIYQTTDPIATVVGSGYFNDVYSELRNGDVIIVVDTNVPTVDLCAVTSADGATTVTTQNGT